MLAICLLRFSVIVHISAVILLNSIAVASCSSEAAELFSAFVKRHPIYYEPLPLFPSYVSFHFPASPTRAASIAVPDPLF